MKTNMQPLIDWHLQYYVKSLRLANRAQELGHRGFQKLFHIEASDALVHSRRIYNFLNGIKYRFHVPAVEVTADYSDVQDPRGLMEIIKALKYDGLAVTQKIVDESREKHEVLFETFMQWFTMDFYNEISEANHILDKIDYGTDWYDLNQELIDEEEPHTSAVIQPFSYWGT